jgi:hypothetical protein
MMERKEFPIGIVLCIVFIIVLDVVFLSYFTYYLLFNDGHLTRFLSFSLVSIVMWLDVFLTILSLLIVPYGFLKRKNWARLFALVFLSWSAVQALGYVARTGEKFIGFPLFVLYVLFGMYLLMSSVKNYFKKGSPAVVPSDVIKEFAYGDYTLYSKLVRLKNAKLQVIYFFSKRKPKSGTPTSFPVGFEVEMSKRSGLPYLKKK